MLRDLIDLANNPKKITAAHELARKEQGLTDEVARKAAEAKDFIAKYNQLSKDIKAAQEKLAAEKAAHEIAKADQDLIFKNEESRLAGINDGLAAKGKTYAALDAKYAEECKAIENLKKAQAEEFNQMLKKLQDKAAADDKIRIYNENESASLLAIKQKLESKAAKFQEAAAI